VFQYIIICEPNHFQSESFKITRSLVIVVAATNVRQAVKFNDEFAFFAIKIHDVSGDWMLSAEFQTIKLLGSQD